MLSPVPLLISGSNSERSELVSVSPAADDVLLQPLHLFVWTQLSFRDSEDLSDACFGAGV